MRREGQQMASRGAAVAEQRRGLWDLHGGASHLISCLPLHPLLLSQENTTPLRHGALNKHSATAREKVWMFSTTKRSVVSIKHLYFHIKIQHPFPKISKIIQLEQKLSDSMIFYTHFPNVFFFYL